MKMTPLKDRIFETIDGVLYAFEKSITESGLSVNYYRKEKSKGNKRLVFLDHPQDLRYNLIAYDTISSGHQEKIKKIFGDPYEAVARQPIADMVVNDDDAFKFFLGHRFNGQDSLPIKRVRQYTRAASWLNMLKEFAANRMKIVKALGINVPQFYDHVESLMLVEKMRGDDKDYHGDDQLPGDFGTSYRRLLDKVEKYGAKNYSMLIDKMYGNQIAAKVTDEIAQTQLLSLIENPLQYDDVLICMMYNSWATQNNYKAISAAAVTDWRRKTACETTTGRYGSSAFNERFIPDVKGLLPSCPLALVEHDDNNLDFLFQDDKGYPFHRYVSINVKDSRTKLLLGKSYIQGGSPYMWMVPHAYLDAMYYIRSITGGWHIPFEIKADRWASATLNPYYGKIAKFVPPAHSNKHRGYIEPSFSSKHWKRSQQLVSQGNWNGHNMTAKYAGVNPDMLKRSLDEKSRPLIGEEAELQIENFYHLQRNMPAFTRRNMNAPSKEDQFMMEWNKLSIEDKRPISDEHFLLTFGIEHNPDRPIMIGNRGVEPQINNGEYSYDLPEAWMYQKYNGAKVNVIYDPYDMSRVLLTNHDDIRFVANAARLTPRALKDHYTGSRTFLNALLQEKSDLVKEVAAKANKRKQTADITYYSAEAMLKGGAMIKELKNGAEQKMLENFNTDRENYLDSKDISDYL